jgi:hypothetical protein
VTSTLPRLTKLSSPLVSLGSVPWPLPTLASPPPSLQGFEGEGLGVADHVVHRPFAEQHDVVAVAIGRDLGRHVDAQDVIDGEGRIGRFQ